VGIAPRAPAQRSARRTAPTRTLADRVISDHRGGNIGGSTFRQSIAALLIQHLGLIPKRGHDRSRFEDERALCYWIEHQCRLSVVPHEQPWLYEDDITRYLNPPLNLRPGFHPYRHEVASARRALRQACSAAQSA